MAEKKLIAKYDGVQVKVGNGWQTLGLGAPVPEGADADHVKVLVERGLVGEGEVTGGIGSDPDATPPFPGVPEGTRTPAGGGYDGTNAPAKSGSKADWVDWAAKVEGVAADSPEGEALAAKTRDELAAAYAERTPNPAG